MEKIASFQVNHKKMTRGIFVSRIDKFGEIALTTFDLRMKTPNREPVLDNPALHTIEHLGATFLRSHKDWAARTVYFGPMGCRTGFYAIFEGEISSKEIQPLIVEMYKFIVDFAGEIPGASAEECGNYQEQNLDMAKYESANYLQVIENPKEENLVYPE
ncbi:MAG: S-ribosylhomocysteine lyase [Prevotellaceae bacterium]|jgi:S-ribosylhomocysteine lyase|nr:S-ribosylhomocysteine lyase [Prevotellaceae bacterium]